MKKSRSRRVLFVAGFLLCSLPTVYGLAGQKKQAEAVRTYQTAAIKKENELAEARKKAQEYNNVLYQTGGIFTDMENADILSDQSYAAILDISGTGIMGSLEIPKINVSLPVYHGTDKETLANGIGHIQGTSLPVGGQNTHCVLSGHRGLPSARLLVRLDEMEEGDEFFLHTGNETLAYRVSEIQVVEPEDTSVLAILPEKDRVSIITCTPYGINTHRLVVTGERTEYKETDYRNIQKKIPSARELFMMFLPVLFLAVAVFLYIRNRRKQRRKQRRDRTRKKRNGRKNEENMERTSKKK